MACIGCPPPKEPAVQRAVRFRAWYIGGAVYEGDAGAWSKLPDDGMLAVKIYFSDGTARNCSGNDWYGLLVVSPDVFTVIHNNNEDNEKRYPNALWKRGKWTSEEEMHEVERLMIEAV